jgi:hypothetical protein
MMTPFQNTPQMYGVRRIGLTFLLMLEQNTLSLLPNTTMDLPTSMLVSHQTDLP